MSGHSKWATTKHKKAVIDARRGKLFAKLIKNIEVAARTGGGDPAGNPTLYDAIQKAKKTSVPNDNIDRAVKRGSGAEAGGADWQTIMYEGYGPNGVAVLIECLTDNRNRPRSGHSNSHFGGRSIPVVGQTLDEHGHATGAIALIHDGLPIRTTRLGARASLDRAVDVVIGNRGFLRFLNSVVESRIASWVATAGPCCHLDVLDELGKKFAASSVDHCFLVLSGRPLGVTGH